MKNNYKYTYQFRTKNELGIDQQERLSEVYNFGIVENKSYSNSPKNPAREQMDFQPDIMVLKNELPLVLIETKYKDFSTQDILTYSEKVIKHKEIFSHLRYGFILGGNKKIDQRYFTHNRGFDFALAIPRVDDKEMKNLIGLLKKEIGILNN